MLANNSYLRSSASLLAEIADRTAVMNAYLASQGIKAGGQVSRSSSSSTATASTDHPDIAARTAALIGKINALKSSTPKVTAESTADLVSKINALTASMSTKSGALTDKQEIEPAVELEVGCMLREMGVWCACCDE